MGVRLFGLATCSALLMAMFMVLGNVGPASAQDATPEASTPEASTPAAEGGGIVTLVGWYVRDESGDFLVIGPLQSNENLVSREAEPTDRTITGRINFDSEENNDLPRVSIGSSVFHAYPVVEGDTSSATRYTYFNDDPNLRPFTLVMQVEAVEGPYDGYVGTVTLISRSDDGSGVIVVVLNPPA
jgi:hypothetical protein